MWWLPFKTLEIKTEQNITEVRSILRWNIAGGYSLSMPAFGIDTQKDFGDICGKMIRFESDRSFGIEIAFYR